MNTEAAISLDVRDAIAFITFDQPERGNPFDEAFCARLNDLSIECDENPAVRAILIRAKGRYFSVGADLKWLGQDRDALPHRLKRATASLHMAISRFSRCDAPIVCATHGLVTGGAVALTAMSTFAIGTESSRYYAAYNGIGFAADGGGSYFLPRRLGTRRANDFILLNQAWSAQEALAYGLLSRVVADDELSRESEALAAQLAAGPTRTYGEMKRLFLSTLDQPLEAQLECEARAIARCARTADSWNAIQSVMAKDKPTFHGR